MIHNKQQVPKWQGDGASRILERINEDVVKNDFRVTVDMTMADVLKLADGRVPRWMRDEVRNALREQMETAGDLFDYKTNEHIRKATAYELRSSIEQSKLDGGVGAITIDGRVCYVVGE